MTNKIVEMLDEVTFKKDIETNFKVLSESSMSRIIGKYFELGFIIISASRDCETVKGSPCDENELLQQIKLNKLRNKEMAQEIRKSRFGFVPTYGGFEEEIEGTNGTEKKVVNELSFIVPAQQWQNKKPADWQKLKDLGIKLSKKYNQDSFLFKPPQEVDKNAYFISKEGDVVDTFSGIAVNDMESIYFTRLRKSNPNRRFSLKENSFSLYVPNYPSDATAARNRMGEIFIK